MKVLVFGAGVIGCYLTHVLCEAGHNVTLLARGGWKDTLESHGLELRHHLQRKTTMDHPTVTDYKFFYEQDKLDRQQGKLDMRGVSFHIPSSPWQISIYSVSIMLRGNLYTIRIKTI